VTGNWRDTIFAVSSGVGKSAIAVIRVCGPRVRFVLETITGEVPPPRLARLRKLRRPSDGAVLDSALVLYFAGPQSETGEDIAEFQVHGGRAVVASVLAVLGAMEGLRPADPGEFAHRALRNGKLDLLGVEALADLIDAETEWQRRQAVEGGGALLRGQADHWRERLLDIRADLEADLDFSDEGDVSGLNDSSLQQMLGGVIDDLNAALRKADRGERLREGYRVVLAGKPNAGKSSLLNAIAQRDVAIVSPVPGTTRDRIDLFLDLGGVPVRLSDTAGVQVTCDPVEQEGIRRTEQAMAEADLVLWLSPADDPSAPSFDLEPGKIAIVATKADLRSPGRVEAREVFAAISMTDRTSVENLLQRLEARARASFDGGEAALLTRARHRLALETCRDALVRAGRRLSEPELAAEEVRLGTEALERLVGRIDVEDVLGAIFSRFCIGK